MYSKDFKSHANHGIEQVYSRNRSLPLPRLLLFIMTTKTALQRDLDRFFKSIGKKNYNIREVTKGALSQARAQLNPQAFKRLNTLANDKFYTSTEVKLWHAYRLVSVDGTRLMLPKHETVKKEFGEHHFGPNSDSPRSMAIGSILYDTLNQVCIDAQIAPYSSSEKELLHKHLDHVYDHDLLLLDRGYPSIALFFLLTAKQVQFCVRMKKDWWLDVKDFNKSEEQERIVSFRLPEKDKEQLKDYPDIQNRTIKCRLVKVSLDTGETEILCTSLLDQEKHPIKEFKELYHYRWQEEEAYKLLKSRIELEKFSGKTATAVKQDFFAKVFMMTMCAVFSHPIEEKIYKEYDQERNTKKRNKHQQKINNTHAYATLCDLIVPIFEHKKVQQGIKVFDDIVYRTKEIVRPNRSNPRNKKPKKLYHQNYKPL